MPDRANGIEKANHLKELLTTEEYEFARASTLNAHYSSVTVISAIHEVVQSCKRSPRMTKCAIIAPGIAY